METLIVGGALVLLVLIVLGMAVRIVPEFRRLVVFRLGRSLGARGPGLILLIPVKNSWYVGTEAPGSESASS